MTTTAERLIQQGRKEGRLELLLKLISARFGAPSAEIAERIRSAPSEEIDRWAERLLTARSISEVLDP